MFVQLLERLALALDKAGFRYMVIGGQAVLLYGEPRLTKDIDVTLDADLDRLADVREVAKSLRLDALVDPEDFTRKTMVLPCRDPSTGIRIDFIFSFSPYEKEAIGRARKVRIGSAEVSFASLEDLVVHKMVAGRPRDLEDVKNVLLKNPGVDQAYLEKWLRQLGAALGEPCWDRFEELRSGIG